jgi:hypothetical protein
MRFQNVDYSYACSYRERYVKKSSTTNLLCQTDTELEGTSGSKSLYWVKRMLEPCAEKLACTVLRGGKTRENPTYPDKLDKKKGDVKFQCL